MYKKILLISVLFNFFFIPCHAQDRVQIGDPAYFWIDTMPRYRCLSYLTDMPSALRSHGYAKCYTPHDTTIHGVGLFSSGQFINPNPECNCGSYKMKIFQQDSLGVITLLDSVPLTYQAIMRARHHFKWFVHDHDTTFCWYTPDLKRDCDSLLEFYFNHPVTVHDTFYVGFHMDADRSNSANGDYQSAYNRITNVTTFNAYNPLDPATIIVMESMPTVWQAPENWEFNPVLSKLPFTPSIFPILVPTPQRDTVPPCPAPNAPVLIDTALGSATLQWQCAGDSCQLHLSAPGLDTLITQGTSLTLLTPGVTYTATLRTLCHHVCYDHDTTQWSPWSEALTFHVPARDTVWNTDTLWINDSTGVVGGELIILDSNATLLVIGGQAYIILGTDTIPYNDPRLTWIDENTAVLGGTLVVVPTGTTTPEGILTPDGAMILRREYYDLLGRRLPAAPARGLYLLRTVTTSGTATRKIIKQ